MMRGPLPADDVAYGEGKSDIFMWIGVGVKVTFSASNCLQQTIDIINKTSAYGSIV
jgi:hypothetical protein